MSLRNSIITSTGSYSTQIDRLKNEIETADAIVIGAGAGLSARLKLKSSPFASVRILQMYLTGTLTLYRKSCLEAYSHISVEKFPFPENLCYNRYNSEERDVSHYRKEKGNSETDIQNYRRLSGICRCTLQL